MIGWCMMMDCGMIMIRLIFLLLFFCNVSHGATLTCNSCSISSAIWNGKIVLSGTDPELDHVSAIVTTGDSVEVATSTTGAVINNSVFYGGSVLLNANVTGYNNAFSASAKTGSGTETFTGELWNISNPYASSTDLHLHPMNGRFLIDSGYSTSVDSDIDNQRVPKGLASDIGADEFWPVNFLHIFMKP